MVKRSNKSSSHAGPTPFHRRSSFLPFDPLERRPRFKWHVYDNRGSYNGWFDWIPEWMRVGYWSPVAVTFLVAFYGSIYWYAPTPLEFPVKETDGFWWAADAAVFAWGVAVVVYSWFSSGTLGAFAISFTGWSWVILTTRAGLSAAGPIFGKLGRPSLATTVLTLGSSLRFPAAAAATITFFVWNFVLLPIIYYKAMPPGPKRNEFLKFNFGFFMTNIHVLNLPLAFVNTVYGAGARLFNPSDLWAAYVVVMLYSMLYLFVLDRLGLHFYPMFCPRSATCALSFGAILALYYYLMQRGNALIVSLLPEMAAPVVQG